MIDHCQISKKEIIFLNQARCRLHVILLMCILVFPVIYFTYVSYAVIKFLKTQPLSWLGWIVCLTKVLHFKLQLHHVIFEYHIIFVVDNSSFGVMSWPAATLGASADKVYEGDWQEGKMCGYGKMRWVTNLFWH